MFDLGFDSNSNINAPFDLRFDSNANGRFAGPSIQRRIYGLWSRIATAQFNERETNEINTYWCKVQNTCNKN